MNAIWKYEIPFGEEVVIPMPLGTHILHVEAQGGIPFMWAFVDPRNALENRRFHILGTGQKFNTPGSAHIPTRRYLGTVLASEGVLVWHVFESLSGPG